MINLSDEYLLFIEPQSPPFQTRNTLVYKADIVLEACSIIDEGDINVCSCGVESTGRILQTKGGRITHDLIVHYCEYHQEEIPESEIEKIEEEYVKTLYN